MSDLATLDIEIQKLQQEAAAVERAGPTFDETWPAVNAELLEAEAIFRRWGPQLGGYQSELAEHVHQRRQAAIGASVVANKKVLLNSERSRIQSLTQGGISRADKLRRLDDLNRQILRAAARKELALREIESDGEFQPRATCILRW